MSSLRAPEHVPASDGNDGLRQAKRRKPTDRALPSFQPSRAQASTVGPTATRLAPSTAALQRLTTSYSRLQDVERKLDWNVARKTAELAESLVGTRIPGVRAASSRLPAHPVQIQRTLRIHLTSRPVGQPWQVPLADVAAPTLPNEVKDEPATEGDEAKATVPVDFATNDGVPRFELDITGELLQVRCLAVENQLTESRRLRTRGWRGRLELYALHPTCRGRDGSRSSALRRTHHDRRELLSVATLD